MDKTIDLQLLLELTTDNMNDLLFDQPELMTLDIFKLSVSQALEQYQNITKTKHKHTPIGRVDTKKVAFSLHDKDTAAILQGDLDFAEMLDLDYIDGLPNNELGEPDDN